MSSEKPENPEKPKILVCFCHGVSEAEIRAAISAGALTLLAIKEATKASTGCGGCTAEVERILESVLLATKSKS